jgi:hypothetical protein
MAPRPPTLRVFSPYLRVSLFLRALTEEGWDRDTSRRVESQIPMVVAELDGIRQAACSTSRGTPFPCQLSDAHTPEGSPSPLTHRRVSRVSALPRSLPGRR